jgi:hypothetical protein
MAADDTLPALCRELRIPLARGERFLRQYAAEVPAARRIGILRLFPREETLAKFRELIEREARCAGGTR